MRSITDLVVAGKVSRYLEIGDYENIHWQLAGEAFGCFLSCHNGSTFEQHYEKLPEEIKKCLHLLGYLPYDEEQITKLLNQACEMIDLVEQAF